MTPRGLFLALGVFGLFLLIFVPLARRIMGGTDRTIDADRLRRVYGALALYEMAHDGLPAPNLSVIKQDVEPSDFQSVSDPYVPDPSHLAVETKTASYSFDGALPQLRVRSHTRVSWSYRWHWPQPGDPIAVRMDPRKGILASWWQGPVLRVNTNGSLVETTRTNTSELTFNDLFGK